MMRLHLTQCIDGICECSIARTFTLFLTPNNTNVAYCEICRKQIIPGERETLYNSHADHHEGFGFAVMNSIDGIRE